MKRNKLCLLAFTLILILSISLMTACGGDPSNSPAPITMPDAREGYVQVVNCSQAAITSLQLKADGEENWGRNVLTEEIEAGKYISLKLFGGKAEGTEAVFSIRVTFVSAPEEEGGESVETVMEFTELELTQATHLKLTPETAEVVK